MISPTTVGGSSQDSVGVSAVELPALLLSLAINQADDAQYIQQAVPLAAAALEADWLALAALRSGELEILGQTSPSQNPPLDLATEALDREAVVEQGGWTAAPLRPREPGGELLIFHGAKSDLPADSVAATLAIALDAVRQRGAERRRTLRLEAILEIAQEWRKTEETEPLLNQMAEASTRLLGAERASLFLWDRPNKTLVGRPALGVEGGELRIADDTGVVGQVVHTGETRRIDIDEKNQIDHKVDAQTQFKTRNLLCVPLRGKSGELFGAFEVLNRREGNFTDEDEAALVELADHAAIALETTQETESLLATHRQIVEQAAEGIRIIGESPAIEAMRSTIQRIADTDLAILILGENGTGKEVASQSIHYLSRRRDQPFVAVNCAALTETLLESELFGHEKGAFTDAHEARAGKFELASGGTLFLDEIGDLSLGGQAKLLRVLEEKVVVRVGGSTSIHTDSRVLAATNQNLAEMIGQKKFREDLYYRLNVVTLEMPPLRERGDDIALLAEHFLSGFCQLAHRKTLKFTAKARKRLLSHLWPGNVRELRNLMERLAYLLTEDRIEAEDLAFILSPGGEATSLIDPNLSLVDATTVFQSEFIKAAIERTRGNMSDAAGNLGLHRSNLYRKMRQLGMEEE